jgi:hypothetical protein
MFGIWFYSPRGGSHDFFPLKFVGLCMEGESTRVELACYEDLMVVDVFFKLLPARNEDGSLPSSQRRYGGPYARVRYDDIALGHGKAQLGGRKAHARFYAQSGGVGVSHLPEDIDITGNYSDKLLQ